MFSPLEWNGKTLLHLAVDVHAKDPSAVDSVLSTLLDAGAQVDSIDKDRNTPLHYAAALKNPQTAVLLLNFGANANAVNSEELRPLHCAAKEGTGEIVTALLEAGAENVEANGRLPVQFALAENNTDTDLKLLEIETQINEKHWSDISQVYCVPHWCTHAWLSHVW